MFREVLKEAVVRAVSRGGAHRAGTLAEAGGVVRAVSRGGALAWRHRLTRTL